MPVMTSVQVITSPESRSAPVAMDEKEKKKPKKQSPPEGQQNFLFVDASNRGASGKANNQNARAFVMQKARRERPWSTTKKVNAEGKTAPKNAAKSKSASAKEAHQRPQSKVSEPSSSPETSTSRLKSVSASPASGSDDEAKMAMVKLDGMALPVGECDDCTLTRVMGGRWCENCDFMRSSPLPISKDAFFAGTLDPFSTFSIPLDGQISSLLHHWIYAIAPNGLPLDGQQRSTLFKDSVLELARDSPAAMAALCCSSVLHQFIVGRSSAFDVARQKAKAITEINTALTHPTQGIRDAVIWAVLNLAYIEETMMFPGVRENFPQQGDPFKPRMIHLMGLRRMVEVRGGLPALGMARCLQAFLIWHVTASFLSTFEQPYLGLEALEGIQLPPIEVKDIPEAESSFSDSSPFSTSLGVDSGFLTVARDFERYLPTVREWFTNPHSNTDPIDLQTHVCLMQCRLTELIRTACRQSERPWLNESFGIGLLAFMSMATDNQDRPIKPMQLVGLKRLRAALKMVPSAEWTVYPPALLWILSVGAINAEDDPEFPFYLTNLRDACRIFSINSFGHLLEQLRRVMWLDCRFDDSLFRLWERVNDVAALEKAADSLSELPRFVGLSTAVRDSRKRASSSDILSDITADLERTTQPLKSELSLFDNISVPTPSPQQWTHGLSSDRGSTRASTGPSPPPQDPWLAGIADDFGFTGATITTGDAYLNQSNWTNDLTRDNWGTDETYLKQDDWR